MKQTMIRSAAIAAMLTLSSALTPAFAQPSRDIPTIDTTRQVSENAVNFVTGGIGDDERQVIEAAYGDYNVHIMFASPNGAFVEDNQTIIRDKSGAEVLNVNAGPLLYAKLPVGAYTVEAKHNDEVKTQKLNVTKKTKDGKVHFTWKVPATTAE